jgi:hypothetical protein
MEALVMAEWAFWLVLALYAVWAVGLSWLLLAWVWESEHEKG